MLGTLVVVLAGIGVYAAVGRILALLSVARTGLFPPAGDFAELYARHPVTTLLHVVPGIAFMVLGPLQLVPRIRNRHPRVHRVSGRLFIALSALIAATALALVFTRSFGGPLETSATVVFTALFVYCLGRAFLHIRRREIALHREWMIRGFAIGLGIATIRPVAGILIGLSGAPLEDVLGVAFWIAFTLHAAVAEAWIRYTRPRRRPAPASGIPGRVRLAGAVDRGGTEASKAAAR